MAHESRKVLACLRATLADASGEVTLSRCAEDALALSDSLLATLERTEEALRIGARASEETMALHARERQHFQQLETTLYALEGSSGVSRREAEGAMQASVESLGQQLTATNLVLNLTQHERDEARAAIASLAAQSKHSLTEAVEDGRRAEDALASALLAAREAGIERDAALALAGGIRGQLEGAHRLEVEALKALHNQELQGERVRYVEAMERHRETVASLDSRLAALHGEVAPLQEEVTTLRSTSMGGADEVARAKAEAGAAREEAARLRVAVLGVGLRVIGTGADMKLVQPVGGTAAAAAVGGVWGGSSSSPSLVGRGSGSQQQPQQHHPSSPSPSSTSTPPPPPYTIMSPGDSQLHLPTLRAAFTHVSLRLAEVEAVAARAVEEAAQYREQLALAKAGEGSLAAQVVALREELGKGVEEGRVRGEELAAALVQCEALRGEVEGLKGALNSAHLQDVHTLRGEVAVAKWGEREAYRKLNLVLGIPTPSTSSSSQGQSSSTHEPLRGSVTLGLPALPMSPPPTFHRGGAAAAAAAVATAAATAVSEEGGVGGLDSPLPLSSTIPFASPPSAWVPPPPTFTATSSAYWQSLKASARGEEGAVFAGSRPSAMADEVGREMEKEREVGGVEEEEVWIGKRDGGQGMIMSVGGGGDSGGGGVSLPSTTPLAGGTTTRSTLRGDLSTRTLSSLPSTPTAALLSAAKIRQEEMLKWGSEANRLTALRLRYTLGRSLIGGSKQ